VRESISVGNARRTKPARASEHINASVANGPKSAIPNVWRLPWKRTFPRGPNNFGAKCGMISINVYQILRMTSNPVTASYWGINEPSTSRF
jgi:hypothetical protein